MLKLRMCKTGLYLQVLTALLRQKRLPVASARTHTPYKQLAPLEQVGRRLHKSLPIAAHRTYPAPLTAPAGFICIQIKEEVHRLWQLHGIAYIHTVHLRHRYLLQLATVSKPERLAHRHYNAHVLALIDRDIAPPIYRRGLLARIVYPHAHIQLLCAVGQKRLHAIYQSPHPFVLIHAHDGRTIAQANFFAVHPIARIRRMADYAAVPFHAARKPCVAQRQIARLKHRISMQQFASRALIVKRPQPSTQLRQKYRAQIFILKYRRMPLARLLDPVIAVLYKIRQY